MSRIHQAPVLTDNEIILAAKRLTDGYYREVGEDSRVLGINFESVYVNYIYPTYEINFIDNEDLGADEFGTKLLGMYLPMENRILIDRNLFGDPRRAFTCWHEVGHAILHGDWYRSLLRVQDGPALIGATELSISAETEQVQERQANLFAAHAAAPKSLIDFAVRRSLKLSRPIRFIGPGEYTLDNLGVTYHYSIQRHIELCHQIAYAIKRWFGGLSVESLAYRVADCGWVENVVRRPFSLHRFAPVSKRHDAVASIGAQLLAGFGSKR